MECSDILQAEGFVSQEVRGDQKFNFHGWCAGMSCCNIFILLQTITFN
jgi:hypothetical protein